MLRDTVVVRFGRLSDDGIAVPLDSVRRLRKPCSCSSPRSARGLTALSAPAALRLRSWRWNQQWLELHADSSQPQFFTAPKTENDTIGYGRDG